MLTLLKVHGLSIEEVARATATTAGAVKQKVHRAYDQHDSELSIERVMYPSLRQHSEQHIAHEPGFLFNLD